MNKTYIENKQYLSVKELSQYMGISIHTIYLWIQLKKIPYYKIGKIVRFNLREIDAWLEHQHINPGL
ncbi:MAG: helix-turn-helix domain-containing protein [Candidatus Omnitrophica bacterium]|nr:helix-turn-helix domain-containing protein [Candidatus Omnitrophota bacterium]